MRVHKYDVVKKDWKLLSIVVTSRNEIMAIFRTKHKIKIAIEF